VHARHMRSRCSVVPHGRSRSNSLQTRYLTILADSSSGMVVQEYTNLSSANAKSAASEVQGPRTGNNMALFVSSDPSMISRRL